MALPKPWKLSNNRPQTLFPQGGMLRRAAFFTPYLLISAAKLPRFLPLFPRFAPFPAFSPFFNYILVLYLHQPLHEWYEKALIFNPIEFEWFRMQVCAVVHGNTVGISTNFATALYFPWMIEMYYYENLLTLHKSVFFSNIYIMSANTFKNLVALREEMKRYHIDATIVTSLDAHHSEYISDHWK